MKNLKTIFLQMLFSLIPIIYYLSIWEDLPENVPTHYNIHNIPDNFGTRFELLSLLLILIGITLGTSLLLLNIGKIDPKKQSIGNTRLVVKIAWALIIIMILISSYIVYSTENYAKSTNSEISPKYIIALVGILFALIGNYMNNLKPNYFIGIRTPWTLHDDENWRKTHYLSSKIWFFGGLTLFVLSLFIPVQYISFLILIFIIPIAGLPIFYSFYLFKKKQNKTNI